MTERVKFLAAEAGAETQAASAADTGLLVPELVGDAVPTEWLMPGPREAAAFDGGPSVARVVFLGAAYDRIKADLLPEAPDREHVAMAYSFPNRGARGTRRLAVGQCIGQQLRGGPERVFLSIHPCLWEDQGEVQVLSTLAHEIGHAAAGVEAGHRGLFVKYVRRMGLEGRPSSTRPGPAFIRWVERALPALPAFPAGAIGPSVGGYVDLPGPSQSRLRLWVCGCEPKVRVRIASDDFCATCGRCGQGFVPGTPFPRGAAAGKRIDVCVRAAPATVVSRG